MDGEPPKEEDFSQIPLVERAQHKNWKARLSAYNDVIGKSAKTASDTDPFFRPFVNDGDLLKKWCLDANAVAQEKGIEAVLAIVTHSGETSARLRPEIVPALVEKALGNARAGTKKKGIELSAMFVEVENTGEGVVTDVLVGLGAKQPKAVAGSVACLKEIVESFGVPGLGNVKPLLKALPKIFGHSDKNVRAEGTSLTLSLYTFLGPALLPALADLKPVQMTDLQKSFDSMDAEQKGAGSGRPTRYTRKAQREREEAEDAGGDDADEGGAEEAAAIDPLSLLDPVNAFALFPADVLERLASSKWKERLEACEECNKVLAQPQNARLSDSNVDQYSMLLTTLGTKCHKDANVNVVMEASKLLEGLARGLGKPFGRYRSATLTGCLERLKERKANVVEALGKALDAIFLTTTLEDVVEDVLTALKSKNPQVKEGTLNFLHRSLKVTLNAPGKDQVKPMAEALVGLLSDSAEPVRTAAAECLGTMMKILGERAFNPFVENVPELQMAKVKDAFGRAEIRFKAGGPKGGAKAPVARAPAATSAGKPGAKAPPSPKKAPAPKPDVEGLVDEFVQAPKRPMPARFQRLAKGGAAASPPAEVESPPATSAPAPKAAPPRALARPAAAAKVPPAAAAAPVKPAAAAPKAGGGAKTLASNPADPVKYRFTSEDAAAQAADLIPSEFHTKLADGAWKVRLEGADELVKWVGDDGGAEKVHSEIMMRFLGKTPGWGEKNFQVSQKLYAVMALMAEKSPTFGNAAASLIIGPLTDKLGDMKLKKPAGEALIALAERTSLAFVLAQSYEPMTKQKAPKAQADALTWIKQQVIDFGIAGIPLRDLISFIKNALGSPNAMVRSSATALLVQVKIFVGADISGFLEDLNPQLLTTINKEFDKVADQTPPEPTREQADLREAAAAPGGKGGKGGGDPLDDLIPRVDLDKLVNQTSLLSDYKNDAWKVRKEAFESLAALLEVKSNQRLKPNMGEVGTVLKKAMADTNLAVKMLALGIISKIAMGMGQPFEKYNRLLVAAVASVCADQKTTTRTAALNTLTTIAEACGSLDPMYAGLATSLETANPALRGSVLGWLGERLQSETLTKSSDLSPLASPVVSCLEDRNGDVRKGANAVLPYLVANAGLDCVLQQTSKLKPASKASIVPLINNAVGAVSGGGVQAAAPAPSAAPTPAPARTVSRAATATPTRGIRTPASKLATPRAGSAMGIPKSSIAGPGRSLAMKSLGSAPMTRPASSMSEDRPSGLPARSRVARTVSAASAAPAPAMPPSAGRTIPFVTGAPEPRMHRLKRDTTRWSLDVASRNDCLDYLFTQMEPHTSPDIFTLLFSKDHKADEDFIAGLSVVAEFYDPETSSTFGLPEADVQGIQSANTDLALKYAAIRLLANNTQLGIRSLEVISNVLDSLSRNGERLSETEVKLFVPALVIKLGDAKFGPKLAPIFEGLDKLIPVSQVVHFLVHYGLEDKAAGKTCKNESLQLIEKAYRKRGSVLRKDDRGFYEAIAKCIADQGTRNSALTLMALLQLQGESRNLQAVVSTMPTSAKDMLANRRATLASTKAGAAAANAHAVSSIPRAPSVEIGVASPRAGSATPSGKRISREIPSAASSPGPTRPSSRGIPTAGTRLPTVSGGGTPGRSIQPPSSLPRPGGGIPTATHTAPTQLPSVTSMSNRNGGGHTRPSMQPLGSLPQAAPAASEATSVLDACRTNDLGSAAESLKALTVLLEEEEQMFIAETKALLEILSYHLALTGSTVDEMLELRSLRRIKHLMRAIHAAFARPPLVAKFRLKAIEGIFAGIRRHYAMLEVWSEQEPEENTQASDLRDYMSMVLSSIIATPSRETVYAMLFNALVDLCQDMSPNQDPRISSEIGVVLQCTYKRVRSIDSDLRNNRIKAGTLLAVIEDMLQVIPPVQWRRRPKYELPHGDLPLRVVKTLLQRVIVYTKEINIGIYDLLQEQFGSEADVTTVYSYIFRISSSDEGPGPKTHFAAPGAPVEPYTERERPASMASSSGKRSSMGADSVPVSRSPTRDMTEAERLVRRLTDTRDNEQRLNDLYAFMKASPENETEARGAIAATLNPAAQTFVWRAIDRRSADSEPRSPLLSPALTTPASPLRSPVRDLHSPTLMPMANTLAPPSRPSSFAARPTSMMNFDKTAPVDDQLAQLKAVFARTTSSSRASSIEPQRSMSRVSSSSPTRPLSDYEPLSRTQTTTGVPRPYSDIEQLRSPPPELI